MQNLQHELIELLKTQENLVIDNQLNKNKIIELGLKVEPQLIGLLIKSPTFKKHFFTEVENILVFDKIKFQRFVNNKSFLPDSYTAFKNKIGLTINDDSTGNFIKTKNDVVLAWPHKDCILEGGQTKEDQKRNEIFWNETLAPDSVDRLLDAKAFTNFKKYDKDGEHKVTEIKGDENLILKGNNLLVLSSLLKTHRGKIKLIYIDPPFNTENDSFRYNDTFNHSTWLTFILNRLEIAKELLTDDGLIFIHLDQIEEAYMKIVCDEVFERENYVNTITVKSSTPSGTKTAHKDKTIIKQKDFILVYRKTNKARFNPQYKRKSNWDTHFNYFLNRDKGTVSSFLEILKENKILSQKESIRDFNINNKTHRKFYLDNMELICQTQSHKNEDLKFKSKNLKNQVLFVNKDEENEAMFYNGRQLTPLSKSVHEVIYNGSIIKDFGMLLCDFWDDIDFQNTQNEGSVSFTNGKKPEELLYRIIKMATNEGDIVLDFFVGSGTTPCVSHKMNRKYIGIEQMDYIQDLPYNRLVKVIEGEQGGLSKSLKWQGGGSFIYAELIEYNQKYIAKIQEAKTKEDVLSVWKEMEEKAFLNFKFNKDIFNERLDTFKTAALEIMKQYLVEILDKNQLYVNFSEIEDESFTVSKEDKALNYLFYKKNN
ncbi:type III restriction-modification system methylation subunit [Psychroflexus torquis ATCC 700755]|uniref:site-specific DNA-methyltransferase (adenine-specific) n=1 Tax=Psychroflexus torquis (strain ATCC 700755 / CIP 106069 / ACAM 623) TaxID=313595 RepID=K4IUL2_PSYTT|nr:site-specific DNA-methyltransferase [Psychroflexus torquis]AFU69155.1 type III restriction-modification system methylation subunit [Psychroflexus torquis ATCC 700755]